MDIKAQRNRFMAFSFAGADLLLEIDRKGCIGYAVGAASPLLGCEADTLSGKSLTALLTPGDQKLLSHLVQTVKPGARFGPLGVQLAKGGAPVFLNGCRWPGEDHLYLTLSRSAPAGPVSTTAKRDEKTGMIGKGDFEVAASEAITAAREAGRDVKLTLIEMGGTKDLVARLDDNAAEGFWTQVGAILRTASIGDATTDLGEGRFSILHDAGTEAADIQNQLKQASKAADPEGAGLDVTGSTLEVEAGMSEEDAARALVYAVDSFATTVKGGFRISSMSNALENMMSETNEKIREFKAAVAERRISFVAQPIVSLKDRSIHHYEMLVRFEAGKSPFEMVNFAEKVGIISDLDLAATEHAIQFISQHKATPFKGLAVNLSGHSLQNDRFVFSLMRLLKQVDFLRERLLFEVTESSAIEDLSSVNTILQDIRKLGHAVCLDDFGAGSAAFQYIKAFDVDYVKLDGGYVRQCLANRKDAMVLKSMAMLCRDLKIKTIAEMVENEDQLKLLTGLGVSEGQGWLFGKPQPLETIIPQSKIKGAA